jgi:hypothetical protein
MPFGKVVAGLVVVVGVATSLYISVDTHYTETYVSPSAFTPVSCSSGDVAYDQYGSPYSVMLPNLNGEVLTGDGPPCMSTGPWVDNHLNYWHLFLNGVFWTYLIYIAALIPAHMIKWSISGLRTRRSPSTSR